MTRRFSLDPDVYQVPTVGELREEWRNVPDPEARNLIAVEAQYLHFHHYLLRSLRHRALTGGDALPIGLSVRAGSLKTATLICGSIAEAALRAHAERRGYDLPPEEYKRTFGRVLGAWQDTDKNPLPDIEAVWPQLQDLHSGRNNVHLYRAIEEGSDFYDILAAEDRALTDAERVLDHLKNLVSA